jgi:hypothetical protein
LLLVLPLGCDAEHEDAPAPSASLLETVDPSRALPAELPAPSGKDKDREEKEAILSSANLTDVLERLKGRFGDEHHDQKYAAMPLLPSDGRALFETWAHDHLRFSELAIGGPLEGHSYPRRLGDVVCIESKAFRIGAGDALPRIASLRILERLHPSLPGSGYSLRAFGDVPTAGQFAGRFCGVYTGRSVTDDDAEWILVGMFDTKANREK